ncbi:uncharacterized protein LOC119446045 [Dermacentor silvarum]|uniref:uncharacterized protein LOC119446045 n=1 Tax=Dermacentor silvarum TaxID=543639 RepID=UPI001897D416|nr:uncharacterized protein LOC119446045 [Dermacentor silvarum]XP_049519808.1 uncharacterized protein LOC119446045 [Dermacentor silvarum]
MENACGNAIARAWILSCALFISLLLVCASTDSGEEEDEKPELPHSSGETPTSGAPPVTAEPCNVSTIDVGNNVLVAKTCSCLDSDTGGPAYYYDEYYDDEDPLDGIQVSARNAEAPARTEAEADASMDSNNASLAEPADTPNRTGSTPANGIIVKDGTVEDKTPCVYSTKNYGESIAVGRCLSGKCNRQNLTVYNLPTTPRPVQDRYALHCKVNTTFINSKLQVADGCVASCLEGKNQTWNETKLDDGRLCALKKDSHEGEYTKRTGVCRNGTCVTADFTPWTHPNGCVDSTTRRNGRVLAVRCTDFCKNNSTQRLQDGTPCLLNYARKVHVPTVSDHIVEGICKNGQCIITPPALPMLMFHVPEEGCEHFVSSVNYTEKVETTCYAWCPGKTTKNVKRGTRCALKTAGRWWSRVTEVGQCFDDTCLDKIPDYPPAHEQINEDSYNCRKSDYVTVEPAKLVVVASCQVECGYSVFENRIDGAKCLLEYSQSRTKRKSQATLGVYKVGVCKGGYCTLGKHPQNIATED